MTSTDPIYDELCAWTLSLGDADFVHQHVVDARMLQTATAETKSIGVAFALVGLHLYLERGFTGREVQKVHMRLGRGGPPWPTFELPAERGALTHESVIEHPEGPDRIEAIRRWCIAVWAPWSSQREGVTAFLRERRVVP